MRKLAVVVAAVLALGTFGAAVGTAGASVPSATKFCNAVKNVDGNELGNPTSEAGAATTVKQLKKVRKAAKGKTKKALNTIVDAYEEVVDGASAQEAFANVRFLKASGTFALAVTKCALAELPDVTIPSPG